jgi:hypothetical protein
MAKPPLTVVSPASTGPAPPRKLGKPGRALWDHVQAEYAIADIGGVEMLMQVCAAQDRVETLAEQITRDGEVIYSRGAPKAHPALREELSLRAFIVRTLQKLGLSFEPVRPPGRPTSPPWVKGYDD